MYNMFCEKNSKQLNVVTHKFIVTPDSHTPRLAFMGFFCTVHGETCKAPPLIRIYHFTTIAQVAVSHNGPKVCCNFLTWEQIIE